MQVFSIDWIRGCETVFQLLSREITGIVFRLRGILRITNVYFTQPPSPSPHAHMHTCALPFQPGRQKEENLTRSSLWYKLQAGLYCRWQLPMNTKAEWHGQCTKSEPCSWYCNNQNSRGISFSKLRKLHRKWQTLRD